MPVASFHSAAASPPHAAPLRADADELIQRGSESLRFPGGEWLIHESSRSTQAQARSDGGERPRDFLYYQPSTHAGREALGEIAMREAGAATLRDARPLLLRGAGRCAVVLGRYVFQRWEGAQGPWWYRVTTQPFGAAAFFLRAYLRDRDVSGASLKLPQVAYGFGHLDLERNVLVTSREQPDPHFPQYLVYSAAAWGSAWCFDAERTRRVNGMPRTPAARLAEEPE